MRISAATSTQSESILAAHEVVGKIRNQLSEASTSNAGSVDIALLFASHHHTAEFEELVETIVDDLQPEHLIGCTAQGVIGGEKEFEREPALALWAASVPNADILSFHIPVDQEENTLIMQIPDFSAQSSTLLLLGEPCSFPADFFLKQLIQNFPELQVFGGMASAAHRPGENRLVLGNQVFTEGAVAIALPEDVRVAPVVSQGCRPFGKPYVITKATRNHINELGGKPALVKLNQLLKNLSEEERGLLKNGLHLGVAIGAAKGSYNRGDFVVRNVKGIDKKTGALVVTDLMRPGQTIQFHLRDADTASEDLHDLLQQARRTGQVPEGALIFSCNGRGQDLFEIPDHDAKAVSDELGQLPLAGFFAAGEVGPVAGQNFLHGFTASVAIFESDAE